MTHVFTRNPEKEKEDEEMRERERENALLPNTFILNLIFEIIHIYKWARAQK